MDVSKNSICKIFGLAVAAMLIVPMIPQPLHGAQLVERIIARVNGEIITQRQFDDERQKLRSQLAQKYSGQELDTQFHQQSKNLLRDLIDQDLLVQKAKDDDINVETDVVKRLDQIRAQYKMPSLEALQDAVEKEGIVWEDFKDNIRRQLLMREVIGREVGSRILLSRGDARKYFESHQKQFDSPPGVHLAEILVSTKNRNSADAMKRAKEALKELQNGAKFGDVAEKYSDSPSAADGGDVGFFKAGTIAPEIQDSISKVDVGDYTGIISNEYGDMIFKVLERRVGETPTFDQVEQEVTSYLYNQKVEGQLRDFLTTLRKESYIRLAPGFVDSGAAPGNNESSS